LLLALPPNDLRWLLPQLKRVQCKREQVLMDADRAAAEAARMRLANTVLSVAGERISNAAAIKNAALMALAYTPRSKK